MTFLIFLLLLIIAFAVAPELMRFLAEVSLTLILAVLLFAIIMIGGTFLAALA